MAQLSLGYDRRTGKRRFVRRRAIDDKDADRKLARLKREWGIAGEVAFVRLDDYLADWLDAVKPSIAPSTFTSYSGHVDLHISPVLGHLTVGALKTADVQRLVKRLIDAGKSPSTIVRIMTTLRMALGEAVRQGELAVNVATHARMPKVERPLIEAMTPERARIILDAVRGDPYEALYVLLLGTGLRAGEACALDWRDVDLERRTVFVRRGKTPTSRRLLPMPGFVVEAMLAHRGRASVVGPEEPVFVGQRTGTRLRVDQLTKAFPRLLVRQGLPRQTVHSLRHGTATLLLEAGVDMRDIADILGHRNPNMTMAVYTHVSEQMKRRAMDALDPIGRKERLTS